MHAQPLSLMEPWEVFKGGSWRLTLEWTNDRQTPREKGEKKENKRGAGEEGLLNTQTETGTMRNHHHREKKKKCALSHQPGCIKPHSLKECISPSRWLPQPYLPRSVNAQLSYKLPRPPSNFCGWISVTGLLNMVDSKS